jgi:hypothetical protein
MKTNKSNWTTEELNFINDDCPEQETWIFFFDCPVCEESHVPTNIPDVIEEIEDVYIFGCDYCETEFARVAPNENNWKIISIDSGYLLDDYVI